jgi:hypothetical protein
MFDPITLLAALGPVVVEAGKAAVQRWIAPDNFKPTTIDDYVKVKELDVRLFESMNNAGGNSPTYPWVEAIKQLMRPTVAVVVLGTWAMLKLQGDQSANVDNFAAAIGFYLFGDRSLFHAVTRQPVK